MALRRHPDVAQQTIGDEAVVMSLVEGRVLGLDPTGAPVWSLVEERDEDGLVAAAVERFATNGARAREDVRGFVSLCASPGPGGCRVASIRLETQAPPPRGPSPVLDPRCAVCGTLAAQTVVFVTERLAAEHAAVQYGGPRPGERRGSSVASPTPARKRATLAGSSTMASSLIRPWHLGQARTFAVKVRARSSAHGRYPPARLGLRTHGIEDHPEPHPPVPRDAGVPEAAAV